MEDKWLEIVNPDEGLYLILGRKRYGKSVLGYYLLELLHKETNKDCYVYGLPEEKTHLLPEFITPIYDLDLPERSIILFDEAYISFHARGSSSPINKLMDKLAGLVGQKEIVTLFITQQSRKLDVGVISAADGLFFKMPSMLQAKFERPEIRRLSESVYEKFKHIDGNKKIYTYVITDDFEGFVTNPKPTFWTEGLSKAFEGVEIVKEEKSNKFSVCSLCGRVVYEYKISENRIYCHKCIQKIKEEIEWSKDNTCICTRCGIKTNKFKTSGGFCYCDNCYNEIKYELIWD